MLFRMDHFLSSLSAGLDFVEGELLGATTNHGKRLAVLCMAMGRHCGWSDDDLIGVAACALLHDNALTAYRHLLTQTDMRSEGYRRHCIRGEENVAFLPFPSDVAEWVKYHHEFVDRSGPFEMDARETPTGAQWIAMTDNLDIQLELPNQSKSLSAIRKAVQEKRGSYYTTEAADTLLAVLDDALLSTLADDRVGGAFARAMPRWSVQKKASELMHVAGIVAHITDNKSTFTAKHSIQIANRAYWMARYYGHDREACALLYLAAAFHDIGKLMTPTAILEKPGKLTEDEYHTITDHVRWSYILLKDVEGFEPICRWAATHHRKLNGTGYPDELPDEYFEQDFFSRLLACLDLYQAIRETRPYHAGRSHEETMAILRVMADKGEIDKEITGDLDKEMAQFQQGDGDVPDPQEYDPALEPEHH